MGTVIICALLILIAVYAVISYRKKISSGCCGGGDSEVKIKPKDGNRSNYEHSATIHIGGMSCQNCAVRVENAFNKTDDYYARVNIHKKSGEILSKKIITEDDVREIIEKCGYTLTGMSVEK
ncbi:MAG: heavy metal-associated domain-containing protein [Clostridia bacterium]|nr:heavy metal-associated domain-containing protein [Clostridia bacterium]